MATPANTVVFAFDTRTAALNAATRHEFAAVTVVIQENASRAIESAYLEISGRGNETTGTSATSRLFGIKVDAVAWSDTTTTETVTHTGDQQSFRWRHDVTSYLVTNLTGTSHSVQAAVQFGGLPTVDLACKLVITYRYNDAAQDLRTKTAWIPIESGTTALTNALAEIGTWQIPALIANWQSFTADAGTNTITAVGHGYSNGMEVVVRNSGGALPGGLSTEPTFYFVIGATTDTFQVSTTRGGSALDITSAGSGTNQVSARYFLPEASITIRDLFFDIMANEGNSGTTDLQLGVQIDTVEAETLFGAREQALDSSPWMEVIWKRTDLVTTLPHAFRARSATITGRFPQLCAVMVVTYTYDHSVSTGSLVSVRLGLPTSVGAFGGTTSGNQQQALITEMLEEPGPISLQQSGVFAIFNSGNNTITGLSVAVGSQTHRAYTPLTAVGAPAGQHSLMHRFDAASAAGAGLTLARGENNITVSWYRTSTAVGAVGAGWAAELYLNYRCGRAAAGAGAHKRTILKLSQSSTAVGNTKVLDFGASSVDIPEADHWISNVAYQLDLLHAGRGCFTLSAERLGADTPADGYQDVLVYSIDSGNELGLFTPVVGATSLYKRFPGDPAVRFNLESSRTHRASSFVDPTTAHGGWTSFVWMVTYHAITFSATRAVEGYSGDGSGITVRVFRDDTNEYLYGATTSAGGSYTITGYDDTIDLFAYARQTEAGGSRAFRLS